MKFNLTSALLGLLIAFSFAHANAKTFANPTWNGYALDWCANFEGNCGKPAADLWCQKKGFPKSVTFIKRTGVSYPTMTVGQNAICNPSVHHCDSFAMIDCQEQVKVFIKPKYNGYRLDWCQQFEQGCGALAAKTYCQKNGYANLVDFQKEGPLSTPTMTVGSNAICNPQFHVCDSFNYIRCKK